MPLLFRLLRIEQWTKNFFIFIPSFFSGEIFEVEKLPWLIAGFLTFSFASSGIYVINDLRDVETDKFHPVKKNRPLAAGEISPSTGRAIFPILLVISLATAYALNLYFFYCVAAYALLNLFYSFGLRNVSIIDLLIISSGFVLRILSGGFLAAVQVSHWLIIMVFLLAMFLVLAKRRDDILIQSSSAKHIRKSSDSYNLEFVNAGLTLFAAVIVVAYLMYTFSDDVPARLDNEYLFITSFFVLVGILRYFQITFVEQRSGSPTDIFAKDKFLIITILLWIFSFYLIIYVNGG